MCKPALWSKGQFVSEISLELVRSSERGTSRERDVLNLTKVPHHPEIKSAFRRLTRLLRGPVKDLQARSKVRKDLALNDDAGEPPIAV